MVAHARADHPEEACGLLVGPEGSGEALRHVPMTNAARSTTFYEFDSEEWKQVYDEMWANDEEVVVAYHSHTATEAYPSRSDAGIAASLGLPGAHYVLVSTRESEQAEVRSFTIAGDAADAEITEEPIEVLGAPDAVQTYRFAHTPEQTVYDCR